METGQSYPLPLESLSTLEIQHHIDDLVVLENFCRDCGIETTKTRVQRYKNYLCGLAANGSVNEQQFFKGTKKHPFKSPIDWQLYVLREVHELMWIVKGLKVHMPRGAAAKLKTVVGGSDFAALDSNSQARDFQFELRTASYFCQAGCYVDLSSETDIIATFGRFAFFIECKRIASVGQATKRLSEAVKQITLRMPKRFQGKLAFGCVAVEITKAAFSHNGLTFAFTSDHARDVIQSKLLKTVNQIDLKSALAPADNRLLRCLFQIHIASLTLHPPTPTTRFSTYCIDNPKPGCRRWLAARMLQRIFESPKVKDPRSDRPERLIRRKAFTFPKGTTFWIDEELFQYALMHRNVNGRRDDDVIAEINIDGTQTAFSFFELKLRLLNSTDVEWNSWKTNHNLARVQLIAGMYLFRHPYEDAENRTQK